MEKTKRSSGDLIGLLDLSDTSQPVANSAIMIGVPCDHALLDSSDPMAIQQIYPPLSSQTESEISTVNHNLEVRSNLQIIAELDATSCQQPSVADLLGLVELPAFQTLGSHETERSKLSSLAEASKTPTSQVHDPSEERSGQGPAVEGEPAALESVGPESTLAGGSDTRQADQTCASPAIIDQLNVLIYQSSTPLIDLEDGNDQAPSQMSPTSTAASSIFSHSSSLTSATGSSLLGIIRKTCKRAFLHPLCSPSHLLHLH